MFLSTGIRKYRLFYSEIYQADGLDILTGLEHFSVFKVRFYGFSYGDIMMFVEWHKKLRSNEGDDFIC